MKINKFTRLLTLILALGLLLSLAACGSKREETAPVENTETAAAEATDTAEPKDTAEPDLLAQVRERGTSTIATEGDWSPWA